MRNVRGRLATLPIAVKVLLVVAAPIVLGLCVLLSPLLVVLAALLLTVAVFALVIQLLRNGSPRRWGIVAAASLVLILVFSGISNALYGGGQSEQATSPERTQEAKPPKTTEQAAEKDDQGDSAESEPRVKQEPSQKPDREAPPPPGPEEKLADLGKVVAVSRVVDRS